MLVFDVHNIKSTGRSIKCKHCSNCEDKREQQREDDAFRAKHILVLIAHYRYISRLMYNLGSGLLIISAMLDFSSWLSLLRFLTSSGLRAVGFVKFRFTVDFYHC